MALCSECVHSEIDYEEYYGGYRQYFVDGCAKGCDIENSGDCEEYKEVTDDKRRM